MLGNSPRQRLLCAALLLLPLACHPGRDPRRLLGRWEGGGSSIEFAGDGRVRLRTAGGVTRGTFRQLSRDEIRVDFGSRWPSGQPQHWRAQAQEERLALCELRQRHCMHFRRPGSAARLTPR